MRRTLPGPLGSHRVAAAASARTPAAASPRPPWEDRRTSWPPGGFWGHRNLDGKNGGISRVEAWKSGRFGRFLDSKPNKNEILDQGMMI